MDSLLGKPPKPAPIIPPAPPPPTLDQAAATQVTGDRLRVRRGRAATDLASGSSSPTGGVGVYRALGGA